MKRSLPKWAERRSNPVGGLRGDEKRLQLELEGHFDQMLFVEILKTTASHYRKVGTEPRGKTRALTAVNQYEHGATIPVAIVDGDVDIRNHSIFKRPDLKMHTEPWIKHFEVFSTHEEDKGGWVLVLKQRSNHDSYEVEHYACDAIHDQPPHPSLSHFKNAKHLKKYTRNKNVANDAQIKKGVAHIAALDLVQRVKELCLIMYYIQKKSGAALVLRNDLTYTF